MGSRMAPNYRRRLIYGFATLLFITLTGTIGYHFIEGWPLLEALYMTIISMTTVGYGEILPLSHTGRIFTMTLLLASIGTVGYVVSMIATFLLEGEFNRVLWGRRMDKRISELADHVIVCGGGPTGRRIAEEFYKTGTAFVVIEQSLEALEHVFQQCGEQVLHLQGDATQDETLLLVGIDRARGLVAALGDDKANVFVVLSARSLNPKLRIISRVVEEENIPKLIKAGADEVVSPNAIGGLRMASLMLRPSVVDFLDQMLNVQDQTLRLEEVRVREVSGMAGRTLREADIGRRFGLLVVAIKSDQYGYRFNPNTQTALDLDDVLIVMGTPEQMSAFRAQT